MAIVAAGMVAIFTVEKLESLNQVGGFVSGFAGALAFVWLVAAYFQQGEELRLQRASLDAQRAELMKMGKYAALEQMARVFEQYDTTLRSLGTGFPRSPGEIPSALVQGAKHWNTILTSTDKQRVHDLHLEWQKIAGTAEEFLHRVVSAVELYEEATEQKVLHRRKTAAESIYVSGPALREIPIIRNYIGTAELVAQHLVMFEPGFVKVQLAGFEATNSLMPGLVKEEALRELRKRAAAFDAAHAAAEAKATAMAVSTAS